MPRRRRSPGGQEGILDGLGCRRLVSARIGTAGYEGLVGFRGRRSRRGRHHRPGGARGHERLVSVGRRRDPRARPLLRDGPCGSDGRGHERLVGVGVRFSGRASDESVVLVRGGRGPGWRHTPGSMSGADRAGGWPGGHECLVALRLHVRGRLGRAGGHECVLVAGRDGAAAHPSVVERCLAERITPSWHRRLDRMWRLRHGPGLGLRRRAHREPRRRCRVRVYRGGAEAAHPAGDADVRPPELRWGLSRWVLGRHALGGGLGLLGHGADPGGAALRTRRRLPVSGRWCGVGRGPAAGAVASVGTQLVPARRTRHFSPRPPLRGRLQPIPRACSVIAVDRPSSKEGCGLATTVE